MIINFDLENIKTIDVAKDFSEFPAGRYRKHGPYTGESLRDDLIIPALKEGQVCVDLKGVLGCAQSFLEETFGGLVRAGYSAEFLRNNLVIAASSSYVVEAWCFIYEEEKRNSKGK